jgi:hypothetical protein
VHTALGRFEAIPNGAIEGCCVLAIRPENVSLVTGTAGRANVVNGRISFASYLGNTLRYDVGAATGQVLQADIHDPWHHDPLPIGREVSASFPASVTLAVSDDG